MLISNNSIQKLLPLLRPYLRDENERRAYLNRALGSNTPVLNRLVLNTPVDVFITCMVKELVDFGEIAPGKPALCALLEVIREDRGVDNKARIDELLRQLREELTETPVEQEGVQSRREAQNLQCAVILTAIAVPLIKERITPRRQGAKRHRVHELVRWSIFGGVSVSIIICQVGYSEPKEERQARDWQVIKSAHGQRDNPARNKALADLVKNRVSLENIDLMEKNLKSVFFKGANLRGANLRGADLREANLQDAILYEANLQNSHLAKAFLWGARFKGANLQGADLQEVNLEGANLAGIDFRGANLWNAFLWGADLQGADLQKVNLQQANLQGAILQEANLSSANLRQAFLWRADLSNANLQEADLSEANLQEARLQGTHLQGVNLHKAFLWGAKLPGVNLIGIKISEANLEGAELQRANLQGANLQKSRLCKAKLQEANLQGANLQRADLRRATGLHPNQVKLARNWEQATYDDFLRKQLGLPETNIISSLVDCS